MAVNAPQPFNAFLAGRQARQDEDERGYRNALTKLELGNAPTEIANRNALLRTQITGAEQTNQRNAEIYARGNEQDDRTWGYNVALRLTQARDPNEFGAIADAIAADPRAQRLGIRREMLTPERANQIVQQAGVQAGVAPQQQPTQMETIQGPDGSLLQRDPTTGALKEVLGRRPRDPAPAQPKRWVSMSPAEIQAAGLPEGTAAQRNPETGEVNILNKREGLSAAEQKVIRDAKMKMPRLNAAARRMDRVAQAVEAISNNSMFDGGEADQYVINRTKEGRELIAAAAQLLPEITALTRVPGIGSQSDLETRLASLQFPSSEFPPEVNRRSVAELQSFLSDLQAAYASITGDGPQPARTPTVTGQPQSLEALLSKYAP